MLCHSRRGREHGRQQEQMTIYPSSDNGSQNDAESGRLEKSHTVWHGVAASNCPVWHASKAVLAQTRRVVLPPSGVRVNAYADHDSESKQSVKVTRYRVRMGDPLVRALDVCKYCTTFSTFASTGWTEPRTLCWLRRKRTSKGHG